MDKIIMHIDVNNAFLSWTAVDLLKHGYSYDIRDSYAVIGGDESKRSGIVVAKSFPAKKMGVVTAETLYQAKKKCKALRVFPPNYELYKSFSEKMMNLIKSYTDDFQQLSVDECFIDYTNIKEKYGDEIEFANKLKDRIKTELGFTVNIGIANNKLCAKMASDFEKPDKVHTCFKEEVQEKLWPLPVEELFGIGKKTSKKLRDMNITTIKELANANEEELYKKFKNYSKEMINSANGIGSDIVKDRYHERDSIGSETTLIKDIYNKKELHPYLMNLCSTVIDEVHKKNKYGYVVCVILKNKYFKRTTHQKKLYNPINDTKTMYEVSKNILKEMNTDEGIRLIGVRLDNLTDNNLHQETLFK